MRHLETAVEELPCDSKDKFFALHDCKRKKGDFLTQKHADHKCSLCNQAVIKAVRESSEPTTSVWGNLERPSSMEYSQSWAGWLSFVCVCFLVSFVCVCCWKAWISWSVRNNEQTCRNLSLTSHLIKTMNTFFQGKPFLCSKCWDILEEWPRCDGLGCHQRYWAKGGDHNLLSEQGAAV